MAAKIIRFLLLGLIALGGIPRLSSAAWDEHPAALSAPLTNSSIKSAPRQVRVLVSKNIDNFILSTLGPYRLVDYASGKEINFRLRKSRVVGLADGIHIGLLATRSRRVRLITDDDISLYPPRRAARSNPASGSEWDRASRRRYREIIDIILDARQQLTVINVVDLESYVKGVLYHEVSHRWPVEAIKAQAVCTRSYVCYQVQENPKNDYDVTSDIYSQVYGGRGAERFRTTIAAEKTRGQVLTYQDKILPAFFHANSGGHTEDVNALWNFGDLPPLRGVVSLQSLGQPNAQWKKNMRLKDIQTQLTASGHPIGAIVNLEILERNQSGRIKTLRITDQSARQLLIAGKDFRQIVGPNEIRSNNYSIVIKGYFIDFFGKGWGHGVGMCQWGAYAMAEQGKTYEDILRFYYPGADMITLDEWEKKAFK
ncbi:MAG: SpoIID/LytB domain-containing protein [Candidatus Omnitrophica bacterium]|nr:SpoIID/LytB domain-containing protein [Candidatus Omnitrophota bacterium]